MLAPPSSRSGPPDWDWDFASDGIAGPGPSVESARTVRYGARDAAPGAPPACTRATPAPGARTAPAPSRRPPCDSDRRHRDGRDLRVRRLRQSGPGPDALERGQSAPRRAAVARDRRARRRPPPSAADQPVARHRDRLPGRHRRLARALAARHPGEPGRAEAAVPQDRRRLDDAAALVPALRRPGAEHLGGRRRRARRNRRLLTGRRKRDRDQQRRHRRPARSARRSRSSRSAHRRSSCTSRTYAPTPRCRSARR